MKKTFKQKNIPLLLVEDNPKRVQWFQNYLPIGFRIIWASSGGKALGMIRRDSGRTYGGILLDHDLQMKQAVNSDKDLSGSDVVNAIISNISREVPILIHSMNPDKSPLMLRKLEKHGFWITKERWYDITEHSYMQWLEAVREEWEER